MLHPLKLSMKDNKTCIAQIQWGYIKSNMMKHISPKYTHEEILVTHVMLCDNLADMFTKVLPLRILEKCWHDNDMRRLREVLGTGGELP